LPESRTPTAYLSFSEPTPVTWNGA